MRPRILIVDDISINLSVLTGMLKHDYECLQARSANEALELLAGGPLPDLILLDIMMPDWSGFEVCRLLKRSRFWSEIPVIFVTARNDSQSESEALHHGGVDFIHKPVNKDVLRARVRLHLQLEHQRREMRRNEARMRQAAKAAKFGFIELDLLRRDTYWSPEVREIFGLTPDSPPPPPDRIPEFVHPEDATTLQLALERAIDPDGSGQLECKYRILSNGELRWIQWIARTQFKPSEEGELRPTLICGICIDISSQEATREQVEYLAYHDSLTNLPNRVLGLRQLEQAVASANRQRNLLAVLYIDLDKFKYVNDTHGHATGDLLLKAVTRRLRATLRAEDTLCRLSGDEFMVLLPNVNNPNPVANACERLQQQHDAAFDLGGVQVTTSLCIGVALFPRDGQDGETLMRNADTALYEAKKAGPNSFRFFEPDMNESLQNYLDTRKALVQALEQQEFELHYQPQVQLADERLVAIEALLRWNRPGHGLQAPESFIGVAEESGLMVPIGRWVLQEACRQAAAWHQAGWNTVRVAVNVSAVQFRQGDLEGDVYKALDGSGLAPQFLELEFTESLLLKSDDRMASLMARWKQRQIRLTIDDFGTGYSSLAYLKRLSIDKVKIDRSFISDLLSDQRDQAIVQAMVHLARALNLVTVAEGIEQACTSDHLLTLGCQEGQGYLFARPMPAAELAAWMARTRAPELATTEAEHP